MKKATFVKGLVAAGVLGLSLVFWIQVGEFYQAIVPTSTMNGQEVWLVLMLFVAHYLVLGLYTARFIYLVIKRLVDMNKQSKGGN